MNIVFLDFDGVLNTGSGPAVPELVAHLNTVTETTGARIVVHSSWRWSRTADELRQILLGWGVTGRFLGACRKPGDLPILRGFPMTSRRDRPWAIQTWLNDHPGEVERFVILDDSGDLGHFVHTPEFIQTEESRGLTHDQACLAINHLRGRT